MTDEATAEERVASLERQMAEMQETHRAALLRAALRAEATRAGMIDLDGLKLADTSGVELDANGDVLGGTALMQQLRRSKPWLFGVASGGAASSSSAATAPPAQAPRQRRATEMTHQEWQAARAELLRRF